MKTYTVIGATGNTGKPITLGLLARGHKVNIVSRSAEKAAELTAKGAVLFEGRADNDQLLTKAFEGSEAVYALIPFDPSAPDYTLMQETHGAALAKALKNSKVKHCVFLSSIGAHLQEHAGVVQGLQRTERKLNEVPELNVIHLRAGYFLENGLAMAAMAKQLGMIGSPVRPDLPIPMVATRDIANKALQHLLNLDFEGKTYEYVLGKRSVTYNEIAKLYGQAIGKPDLKYVQVSYEDFARNMKGLGMGESAVAKMNEFVSTLNEGKILEDVQRTPQNTTETGPEEFASVFKAVYNAN